MVTPKAPPTPSTNTQALWERGQYVRGYMQLVNSEKQPTNHKPMLSILNFILTALENKIQNRERILIHSLCHSVLCSNDCCHTSHKHLPHILPLGQLTICGRGFATGIQTKIFLWSRHGSHQSRELLSLQLALMGEIEPQ